MDRDNKGRWKAKISATELSAILNRIALGESVASIAREYGISQPSLSYRFIRNMPEAYKQARIQQMHARLKRYTELALTDGPDISKYARWLKAEKYHAAHLLPEHFPAEWKQLVHGVRAFRRDCAQLERIYPLLASLKHPMK